MEEGEKGEEGCQDQGIKDTVPYIFFILSIVGCWVGAGWRHAYPSGMFFFLSFQDK